MRLSVLALLLTMGLVPVSAQRPRPDRAPERPHLGMNFSEDQKKQVEALRAKHKDAIEAKRKALDEARKAFQEATDKPDATLETLRSLHQALADKQFDLMQTHRSQRLAVRELLTPEQRERAERMRGRHEGMRMGRMMDRGPERRGERWPGMRGNAMEGHHPEFGPMAGPRMHRMADRLGLSEDQRKAFKELHEKQRSEGEAQHKKLQEARKAFTEAAERPDTKAEELKKLHGILADAQFEAMTARRAQRAGLEKILTPEQREKIKTAMEHRSGFRGRK